MGKLLLLLIAAIIFSTSLLVAQSKSLFNGKDLTGWHIDVPDMDKDKSLKNPFIVRSDM